MDSTLTTIALPLALGIIMFGLGLSLSVADFTRVVRQPKAVAIALACQLALLPALCFGLVLLWDLPPILGMGMMLLAASPGGTSANLYSHLFRGDIALNITLTGVNSVIAIVSLPVIANLTIAWYDQGDTVSLQFGKVLEVFAIVLVPVVLGMLVRSLRPAFAARMDRPVRTGSALILALLVVAIIVDQRAILGSSVADVGLVAGLFCAFSLVIGFVVPRAFGVVARQAIACSMEIGVHNATLAIYVAVEVLDQAEAAVPAAVYAIFMFPLAALWGMAVSRRVATGQPEQGASPAAPAARP